MEPNLNFVDRPLKLLVISIVTFQLNIETVASPLKIRKKIEEKLVQLYLLGEN
jgi:hypothetical protein